MQKLPATDVAVIDLLRQRDSMSIADFVAELHVTATAVRQRLNRLLAQGFIERKQAEMEGPGRPSHQYGLTDSGRRQTGANFSDLAVVLWQEIRSIPDPEIKRGLLARISSRLAAMYASHVEGKPPEERMQSIAKLFADRDVPVSVVHDSSAPEGSLPVLNVLACPYPDLAEQDQSICSMERMLFSELLGQNLKLDQCRLDGGQCCSFTA